MAPFLAALTAARRNTAVTERRARRAMETLDRLMGQHMCSDECEECAEFDSPPQGNSR